MTDLPPPLHERIRREALRLNTMIENGLMDGLPFSQKIDLHAIVILLSAYADEARDMDKGSFY